MRIVKLENGVIPHEAYKVHQKYYQRFPRSSNRRDNGTHKKFETIEEAAIFLIQNPDWQIQVNPDADIHASGLVILGDDRHGL